MKDKALDASCLSPSVVYQPSLDEPCIFTNNHRRPVSRHWVNWYVRNNPQASVDEALEKGKVVVAQLTDEIMREVDLSTEPTISVEMMDGSKLCEVLRLEWVIWYRFAYKVGFGSAWWAGHNEIDRLKEEVGKTQ